MQEIPFLFILGGIEWRATKINHDTQQISVVRNEGGNIPRWRVPRFSDVPFEVAQECGRLLITDQIPAFLDEPAQKGLDKLREHYYQIGWNENTWAIHGNGSTKIYLWTFSGDKINRVLTLLTKTFGLGKANEDYQGIEISFSDKKASDNIQKLIFLLKDMKNKDVREIEILLKEGRKKTPFSKFSGCLPAELSEKALFEKSLDISGFLREIKKVTLTTFSSNVEL